MMLRGLSISTERWVAALSVFLRIYPGNLGLVQAAVATAEARLTAVFNIAIKEIAEQIGREAAARVISAENRAAQADRMLKDTKEQAMAMIKRIQDSFQRRVRVTSRRCYLPQPACFRQGLCWSQQPRRRSRRGHLLDAANVP